MRDDSAAAIARFGAEIDDPIRELDDVEVVLDEHERVSCVHESLEHLRELQDVLEVQARRRLVHEVELASRLPPGRGELTRDLHPLRLASG
ncbi:MAG TPA: hypothetical protein VKH19_00855 [Gemmatimonadaceae bacterium]|nr:hypothetical protein [Gemmatimonadaceae bacterium]